MATRKKSTRQKESTQCGIAKLRVGVVWICGITTVVLALSCPRMSFAQEEEGTGRRAVLDVDRRAKHLFDKAIELMEYKQYERGLTMLDTVIRDNEGSILAHRAHMAMGKHFQEQHKPKEALSHFLLLSRLLAPVPGETQKPEEEELYKEALYEAGVTHYQAGQYTSAFPIFRRLTEVAGKSKWANMAYYYIGMSHYNLKNWNKAIDALSLVGTEIDDTGEKVGRIEIGQRFYAKISDADIEVLRKLGKDVKATVTVSNGDILELVGVPIAGKKHELLCSAPTQIGDANPDDDVLQMHGGDTLTVTYIDDSTLDGEKGVVRTGKVTAVSTGTIGFFLGDYSTPAYIAFPGQPQAILLRDADLDVSPKAESVTVTVKAMYKVDASEAAEEEADSIIDIYAIEDEEEDVWKERDSITVTLTERGEGDVVRTGEFVNAIKLAPLGDVTPNPKDQVLHCDELDELVVTYTDKVHLYGTEPRESTARVKMSGSVNAGIKAEQHEVYESVLKAKKNSVEAEALKGLGEIYKDMGLDQRAAMRADEALKKVDEIILDRASIPGDILENAFRLKWECEFLKDDFTAATATCQAFNRLYPQSVLADQALMMLSRTLAEKGEYAEAVASYNRVLDLKNPISAAEAQYRIGEVLQKQAEEQDEAQHGSMWTEGGRDPKLKQRSMGGAIAAYRKTYENYPESEFAAEALSKVVHYYVDTEDFAQASDLLEQVFADFPDADFMDEMLMLWAQVGVRMGDNDVAAQKLQKLIFEYPESKHVADARKKLAALKNK